MTRARYIFIVNHILRAVGVRGIATSTHAARDREIRMPALRLLPVALVVAAAAAAAAPPGLRAQASPVRETFGDPMEIPAIRDFLVEGGFGERAPGAPEAVDEFGRLAGVWYATQEVLRRDGSRVRGEPALWAWKYALGGYAVHDLWYQARDRLPDYLGDLGRDYLLSSRRVYDVRDERWKVAWMANGAGETPGKDFGTMEARAEEGRIVMTSEPGEHGVQRVVFSEIAGDSFRWASEYSQDDGETWTTVMRVTARRIR